MGAMHFPTIELQPGQEFSFILPMGLMEEGETEREMLDRLDTKEKVLQAFQETRIYWENKVNVTYETGDKGFNSFMHWGSFKPILRRIYGCSFLPTMITVGEAETGGIFGRIAWRFC